MSAMETMKNDHGASMAKFAAAFLEKPQEEQYAGLNSTTKAAEAAESVLAVKGKLTKDQKFREKQKETKQSTLRTL